MSEKKIDPQMQLVLIQFEKLGAPPVEFLTPENARNAPTLKNAAEELIAEHLLLRSTTLVKPNPQPVGKIDHLRIPTPEGELLARVFTPKGDGPFPVLVYFHGGGWVIANLDVYEPSCRALCNAAECIVVSVAYRQAPEHPYPAAVNDAYAATQWVFAHAASFGGDPARVAVGGESAGANLATVACLKARGEGGQMPVHQLLIYPATDARGGYPSYAENQETKPLNAAMMTWFYQHYLTDPDDALQPPVSPLLAPSLSGLSPATVITAEFDPLRDEGEAYAKRLAEAGVPVTHTRYEGVTHEFFGLSGMVVKAMEAVTEAATALKMAFGTTK